MKSRCFYEVLDLLSSETAVIPVLKCYFFDQGQVLTGFANGENGSLLKCVCPYRSIEECMNAERTAKNTANFFIPNNEDKRTVPAKSIWANGSPLEYVQVTHSPRSRRFTYSMYKHSDVHTSALIAADNGELPCKALCEQADSIGESLIFYLGKSGVRPVARLVIWFLENSSRTLQLAGIDELVLEPGPLKHKASNTDTTNSRKSTLKLRKRHYTLASKNSRANHPPVSQGRQYSKDFLELISKTNLKRKGNSPALFAYDAELRTEIERVSTLISHQKTSSEMYYSTLIKQDVSPVVHHIESIKPIAQFSHLYPHLQPRKFREIRPLLIPKSVTPSVVSPSVRSKRGLHKASSAPKLSSLLSERKRTLMKKYEHIPAPLLSLSEQKRYSKCFQPIRTVCSTGKVVN